MSKYYKALFGALAAGITGFVTAASSSHLSIVYCVLIGVAGALAGFGTTYAAPKNGR